jgi:thioredoxin:protein disulfide reductase
MLWTLLGIFAGGMAHNLTPCVYPLIPITVSYFGGQATRSGGSEGRSWHTGCVTSSVWP